MPINLYAAYCDPYRDYRCLEEVLGSMYTPNTFLTDPVLELLF